MVARLTLLVALVAAALLVLAPGRAAAAARLVAADPADGAALGHAPDAVVLIFSAPPDPALSHVSTRDAAGREAGGPVLSRTGRTGLRLAVAIRTAGDYTTAYHVVLDDGTEAAGMLRFSVGTGAAPRAPGADAARPATTVPDGHDHGVDPFSATLLTIDLAVLAGVVLLLLRRPASRPRRDDGTHRPGYRRVRVPGHHRTTAVPAGDRQAAR